MAKENGLQAFESRLGYRFRDRSILHLALTHRSWANEQNHGENYERIEFLGDAVLGLVTSEWLYRRFSRAPEGRLSKLKSYGVSAPVLAAWASDLGLGEALRLGVGEERSGGREKSSLLADVMEATLGAIYLDGGLEAVRSILVPLLESTLDREFTKRYPSGSKSALQELLQGRGMALPEYRHVAEEGPDHDKRFHVECWIEGRRLSKGSGATKKRAEERAARVALESLSEESA